MLTLSHIPAQHFISFQDEATDISMSSVPLCLLLPRKTALFLLPLAFTMAVSFSDHSSAIRGWCRVLRSSHPGWLHCSLGWWAFGGLFFGEVFVTSEGKTCSFSWSRGNCSNSSGSSSYKAMELHFVRSAAGELEPPFNPSIQGLYIGSWGIGGGVWL